MPEIRIELGDLLGLASRYLYASQPFIPNGEGRLSHVIKVPTRTLLRDVLPGILHADVGNRGLYQELITGLAGSPTGSHSRGGRLLEGGFRYLNQLRSSLKFIDIVQQLLLNPAIHLLNGLLELQYEIDLSDIHTTPDTSGGVKITGNLLRALFGDMSVQNRAIG